ncbi:VIT1/CCC1 transporter family protein [Salegentibacter sp. JZCK2]|uniref:VIT1/CCC1 transporter family protein n=1 Tax=Salegentibacter tibetensis TaxID=2873600 RepID=UPI001CCFC465|nr:VIT1/CCC1 transporter family protein [Salegentibacter tibetensis]MBZ9730572.1 VIT1/CCC1 transporter family protein [Salegentibacter tibetensis]
MQKRAEKIAEVNNHFGKDWFFRGKEYVGEFVYGGIDGAITTFAIVAGAEGANLGITVVVILGLTNLIADGFSMSVGNFFSVKSERDNFEKHKQIEYWEIDNLRDQEIDEIREIYKDKGFSGKLLEDVVKVITSDKKVWVDTMMKEELEMVKGSKTPYKTAAVTFFSFIIVGSVPLLSYFFTGVDFLKLESSLFLNSCILTAIALSIVGGFKSYATQKNILKGILETVFLGGSAAIIAFYAGTLLESLFVS